MGKTATGIQDIVVGDAGNFDLVIPIIGPSGAGKSAFINRLFGKEVASVSHGVNPYTSRIQAYPLILDDFRQYRVMIVDTPGFDEGSTVNQDILRRLAGWLAQSYGSKAKCAGVVYLHEIIETHLRQAAEQNLFALKKLCGTNTATAISLVTTKWDEVQPDLGTQREEEMKKYWKDLLRQGSEMYRLDTIQVGEREIIAHIIQRWTEKQATHGKGENTARSKIKAKFKSCFHSS